MKLYDPQAKCPKCGHETVRTRFRPGGDMRYRNGDTFGVKLKQDVLERMCARCDYLWDEAPLKEKS